MADYISINGKKSKYGIKLSGKAEKVIEEIKKHTNEKGYFNFELLERKEPGRFGETHYVKVDDWKPTPKADAGGSDNVGSVEKKQEGTTTSAPEDDLPF